VSYWPGEVTTAKLNRAFPFKVDIAQPRGGLGRVELTMTAWCRQHCEADAWACRPHEVREAGHSPVQCLRFYFGDAERARRFREAFGGTLREPPRRRGTRT
jgi:hypothetical protein